MCGGDSLDRVIALRTVPVILRNGSKQIKVNAFLDEGSNRTFVGEYVASQLELDGDPISMKITVLGWKTKTFK